MQDLVANLNLVRHMDHHRPILLEPKDQLVDKEPNMKFIYFAIATTRFGEDPNSICEIAAMGEDDESPWSINILPSRELHPKHLPTMDTH